jgi:hypothetical protein
MQKNKIYIIYLLFLFFVNTFSLQAQSPKKMTPAQAPSNVPVTKGDPVMPVYKVDGVEMPYAKVIKLNTSRIESMNVLQPADAVAKYGTAYKHGLVLITMKKGKK